VSEACKACLARRVNQDETVRLELLDQLDHQENADCPVCLASQGPKAIEAFRDWMVPKEKWEDLV
jgi:hypothetical protein